VLFASSVPSLFPGADPNEAPSFDLSATSSSVPSLIRVLAN
jgi:hypothetical protein